MRASAAIPIRILAAALLLGTPRPAHSADGPILIDPEHPHSFRYSSGERFFPMGDTTYFLIAQPKESLPATSRSGTSISSTSSG